MALPIPFPVDAEVEARVARLELPFSARGLDPYGVDREELARFLSMLRLFYKRYLRVRVAGAEHVPARGGAMLIGNHSGGIALDAGMVIASIFFEKEPPRLAQGMVEKFLARTPFGGLWTARTGQITGTPENCVRLLGDGRLLMVFPEGARGTAKLYWQRYDLVEFGTGFMRLAMQTRTPIIPFGVAGAGEAIPTVVNLYTLGKLVGAPYLPVTPWVLPLPRPRARMALVYGEPMWFEGSGHEEDHVVAERVDEVKARIAALIEEGRRLR